MKKLYMIIILVVLLSSSLVVNTAHATKGWMTNTNPKMSHNTANQIGMTKVCGDHKCAPYEYAKMQKVLYDTQKNNQAYHFFKSNSK